MAEMDDQKLEDLMRALGITPGAGAAPPTQPAVPEKKGGSPKPTPPPFEEPPPMVISEPAEKPVELESFKPSAGPATKASVDLFKDIKLKMKIELGRARLPIQELLGLQPGSVVELDKLTGDPLDIMVNDVLVARGEVLVINENFAIRITEVVTPEARAEDRLKR